MLFDIEVKSVKYYLSRIVLTLILFLLSAVTIQAITKDNGAAQRSELFVSSLEVEEGKRIAESVCAECHGIKGVSVEQEIPHIAGQHAEYIFNQLKAYQTGVRQEANMQKAIGFLNQEAMTQVAAYYASLDLPVPDKPIKTSVNDLDTNALDAGKAAAASCAACHGADGNGAFAGMPSITGQMPEYLISVINAYKNGDRKDAMMQLAVQSLSDDDIENIALYYALQPPKGTAAAVTGDANVGKAAAAACSGCHGELGVSSSSGTPSLAGQDSQYLIAATNAYKSGARNHDVMQSIVSSLSDDDIANLATFFATQSPQAPNVAQPLSTEQWVQKCDRCHGINGNSINPQIPSLSGQHQSYLVKSLNAYKDNTRKNTMMHAMSEMLNEKDINKLASYYSSKIRRSVIFVNLD